MLLLTLPTTISSISLSATNFISLHPELISELAGHALVHNMYSHMHSRKRTGVSHRLRRKAANQRRRWFVDNIILHHKRLHEKNRELIVSKTRDQVLAKREALKKSSLHPSQRTQDAAKDESTKWRERVILKDRASSLRGRVDARRMRARSRWLSVAEDNPTS